MLLILTSEKDLTADFLIVELINRELPYFRLNAEDLTKAEFTFSIASQGVRRELRLGTRHLDLREVDSVWYRRVIQPTPLAHLPIGERIFVAGELRHLAMGIVLNPDVIWVNPIDKVFIAEHKLYQLQIAREIGFRVPRTLVSCDPAQLRDFAATNRYGTICKPIFHGMFVDETSSYSIYTRRVTAEAIDAGSVRLCPAFFQEEIARSADVRATFIGPQCFVADVEGDESLVDWRDPDIDVRYSVSSLSDEVETMCRAMLQKLGLVYGAFDFVKTPEGEWIFLEVNPTGEWAWLENRLAFPMRDAFIQLFFGGEQ
jgi:glutathione synthase/RimK-type ligase-like ATP-grasp enzyme